LKKIHPSSIEVRLRRAFAGPAGYRAAVVFALALGTPTLLKGVQSTTGFYTVSPCRVADTRGPAGPWGAPSLAANTSRSFQVTGRCGIPSSAEAIVLNVTVTDATTPGDIRISPTVSQLPTASAINYRATAARANNGSYALSTTGELAFRCDQSSGSVNLILDVSGYFETSTPPPTPTPTPPPTGGGAYAWSTHFGGATAGVDSAKPTGIVVDSAGASFVLGTLNGTVNFGGGSLTSAGGGDVYLVKYSSSGSHLWSRRFGGTQNEVPKGIAVDTGGNVLITGYFRGSVDFGGGALSAGTSAAGFLAKYSSSGAHVWSRRLSSGDVTDEGTAVGTDGAGNVLVAAGFFGTVNFGGGALTSAGSEDIALLKYNSAGTFLWSKRIGGSGDEITMSLSADRTTGEFLIAGYFAGTVDFGGGRLTSAGANDVFVARYDASGVHQWSRRWGSNYDDKAFSCDLDGLGNAVVTGVFTSNVDFGGGTISNVGGTGSGDIFLVKLSSAGDHLWSKGFGSSLTANQYGYGVAFDASGSVLLTGAIVMLSSPYTIDFGGGPFTGDGYSNTFIAKFGSDGSHIWSKRFLGGGGHTMGLGITSDSGNNVLATGYFDYSINFGGSTMSSPGGSDAFLVKFGP
jgi:Beta-propeller repeat